MRAGSKYRKQEQWTMLGNALVTKHRNVQYFTQNKDPQGFKCTTESNVNHKQLWIMMTTNNKTGARHDIKHNKTYVSKSKQSKWQPGRVCCLSLGNSCALNAPVLSRKGNLWHHSGTCGIVCMFFYGWFKYPEAEGDHTHTLMHINSLVPPVTSSTTLTTMANLERNPQLDTFGLIIQS